MLTIFVRSQRRTDRAAPARTHRMAGSGALPGGMAPPDHATSSSDSVVAEQRDTIRAPHHMTRTATPIPRGVADVTANAAVVPGRLLVLSLSQRDADEHLAAAAARIEPLRKAGWRIEWLAAAPQPTRWTDRTALRRTDTGSHLVAQEAYAAARAAYDRARLDAPPAGYFRRMEQRLSLAKHPTAGARRPGAVKRLLARLAFRLVRPLRKLQERMTPPAPRLPATPPWAAAVRAARVARKRPARAPARSAGRQSSSGYVRTFIRDSRN